MGNYVSDRGGELRERHTATGGDLRERRHSLSRADRGHRNCSPTTPCKRSPSSINRIREPAYGVITAAPTPLTNLCPLIPNRIFPGDGRLTTRKHHETIGRTIGSGVDFGL